jgi:hypothetical protein
MQRMYPEDNFYHHPNGGIYKKCKRYTEHNRKRERGRAVKTGATNAEYASMFLEPTHLSSALTVLCYPYSVSAKSSTRTENGKTACSAASSSLHANTTNETNSNNMRPNTSNAINTMMPTTNTVSFATTNEAVYPDLGSDDDHPQLSTDIQTLISELASTIGASSAMTIITLTREMTKTIDESQEVLCEVRNVYTAPLGMRMSGKVLGMMAAPLFSSVSSYSKAPENWENPDAEHGSDCCAVLQSFAWYLERELLHREKYISRTEAVLPNHPKAAEHRRPGQVHVANQPEATERPTGNHHREECKARSALG